MTDPYIANFDFELEIVCSSKTIFEYIATLDLNEVFAGSTDIGHYYAGSGLHAECSVGLAAVAIPNPCLLSSASDTKLVCKLHLLEASFTLSSGASSQAHLTGKLTSFISRGPLVATFSSSSILAPTKAALSAAVSQISDRRQDHISGHWSHPALLDCSLHLAASLADPAGMAFLEKANLTRGLRLRQHLQDLIDSEIVGKTKK